MLYWLLFELLFGFRIFTPFRVVGYITFRTALASLTALFLCMVLGPWLIRKLKEFQIGQHIREEGPKSHMKKAGTPTMGGVLIIISILVPTLLWSNLKNPYIWIALFAIVSFGAIGFMDDYQKVRKKHNLGLTGKRKFALQCLTAFVIAGFLLILREHNAYSTAMNVPFFKWLKPSLVIEPLLHHPSTYVLAFVFFFLFVAFIVVGSSNAVNLTDGLDGLAIGLIVIASAAMTALTYTTGHAEFARYLDLVRVPAVGELAIFCGAMTGASLGFLWYNAHPAEIFMGDVGSLALGGSMGVCSVLIKQEILLVFIGGVFVIETLSVILQVASFKLRGKRVFKMAPLHHHFESLGWEESKIIVRFWIVGIVMALFALTTLKLR